MIFNENYFIWPKKNFFWRHLFKNPNIPTSKIENSLREIYKNQGYPILVSSGRVALSICIDYLKFTKKNKIQLFPYASNCVRSAINKHTKYIIGNSEEHCDAKIIYHQLGYVQNFSKHKITIEDGVDSFLTKGGKLFPLDGIFEIWSLRKIFGCIGGGIIWCKNPEIAKEINSTIKSKKLLNNLVWILKILSSYIQKLEIVTEKLELLCTRVPRWSNSQIMFYVKNIDHLEKQREQRLSMFEDVLPSWLKYNSKRLPCCVPLYVSEKKSKLLFKAGLISGYRHIEKFNINVENSLEKIYPIPVHHQIPINFLEKIKDIIKND
tara:strand:- start:950 stop:1915 length:966 start_codon:yes stop_codon:yes gene_type:complete